MKIKLYVKEGGIVVFECHGVLKEPLEKVVFDKNTNLFSLIFKDSGDIVELDCPVDDGCVAAMGSHSHCAMGFTDGKKILGATLVPIEGV